jgi:hypothetical protein
VGSHRTFTAVTLGLISLGNWCVAAQENSTQQPIHDAVTEAQQTRNVAAQRPEQKKTEHDSSNVFNVQNAQPSSPAIKHAAQTRQGFRLRFLP